MTCCTCRVCSRWSWFGSSSSRMFNLIQHFCLNLQVVVYILSFLHASDRKEASLVCRSWYSASQDPRFQVTLPRPQQRRWIERWLHILTVFFQIAEERHLPLPGFGLVPGAHQGSGPKATLQPDNQPARWLQHLQIAAAGGAVLWRIKQLLSDTY